MKNFLLGVFITIAGSSFAMQWHEDGGITLTAEEVEQTRQAFFKIEAEYVVVRDKLIETTKELNKLKNSKCM